MRDIDRLAMSSVEAEVKRCNKDIEELENHCWLFDEEGDQMDMNQTERADFIIEAKQDREVYLKELRTYAF